jgi:hypothetical protein
MLRRALRPMQGQGLKAMNQHSNPDASVAHQLRPLVAIVAAFSMSVFALLVTTASLGASPIDSTEVAVTDF